ncbi:hypothetical protein OE749_01275 [Aestuariibacter sp. AA17]|uniref:Antitermination protein n=1 Tax=Fluctibacter corallii TaxID=2984329 RepID=A0ABT3A3R3_9ALTE|nr:hypothetical protein [Aestuariibacter sp. AA17]MCV2883326.1 hypothetical protein [Aestuariibacter sp. AA17]
MSTSLLNKLVPHGVSLDSVGAGRQQITRSDVAAALGFKGLSKPASYFGLAKYCDDNAAASKLTEYLESYIEHCASRENWSQGLKSANGLAQLMMLEGVYGVTCKKCKGVGSVITSRNYAFSTEECGRCRGTGAMVLSGRQRASIAEISPSSWERHWKSRLDFLLQHIYELEDQLHTHLKRQFN